MESFEFAEEFRENRIFLRADRVVRPYGVRGIRLSKGLIEGIAEIFKIGG